MVLVQINLDKETDKMMKQYMLDADIEIKAKAIETLIRCSLNELVVIKK